MIKFLFLIIFLIFNSAVIKADSSLNGNDEEFISELNIIKDPFENGMPKEVVVQPKPTPPLIITKQTIQLPKLISKPVAIIVLLPQLDVQGVMVGDGLQEAIINDQEVPLHGSIKGAKIIAVTKNGVELLYKKKKFFLKVE
jgi:hypothetical protein